jgi:hypothetical protein
MQCPIVFDYLRMTIQSVTNIWHLRKAFIFIVVIPDLIRNPALRFLDSSFRWNDTICVIDYVVVYNNSRHAYG